MVSIPHSRPWLNESDMAAVRAVLDSEMIAQGDLTSRFEERMGQWVCAEPGVAVTSGSAALHLALLSLAIGKGDEVILPTYVCRSVLEAVLALRATPIVCDIGNQWVVQAEDAAPHVTNRTRAIIVPHIYGIYADTGSFRQFGLPIIEDCAQAIHYEGQRAIQGDMAIFSFHPTKCLTTGEGGMVVTNSPELSSTLREWRDGRPEAVAGRVFCPLSDLGSALGLSQLDRYEHALERRQHIASQYRERLRNTGVRATEKSTFESSMHFRFTVEMEGGLEAYESEFSSNGIVVRRGVDELLHRLLELQDADFPTASHLFSKTISLPIYPMMSDREVEHCVTISGEIFSRSRSTVGN